MSDDFDEDLKRAIALSLLDSEQIIPAEARKRAFVISDSSCTESSDAEEQPAFKKRQVDHTVAVSRSATVPASAASTTRAELERERLSRREIQEASGQASTSKVKLQPSSKPRVATFSSLAEPTFSSSSSSIERSSSVSRIQYPDGHVTVTWNRNFPHDQNSMSFAQAIGDRKTLKSALLCAYCIEPDWVVEQFSSDTPVCVIHDGKEPGFFVSPGSCFAHTK